MPTSPTSVAQQPSYYRWMIVVLATLVVLAAIYRINQGGTSISQATQLRKMSIVPPFALTERSGKPVTNRDLAGKIWIADFIYTTCPGPCPLITANMANIQGLVANDPQVMLVSFTVDPQTDTPDVLAKYANQFHADQKRWWFLTGPEKPLYDLIQNGFYQVVQDNRGKPPQDGQFTVTHSTYLALVDADGYVRGFYDGIGTAGRADLLRDVKVLENEESQ